jgi:N-acetylglucosaminyl-diphospho-decaprenol L-rhamnosyltransferase
MTDVGVTIAIVTYKSADLTIDCLRSIEVERSTPGLDIRVMVVDNASGDAPKISQAIVTNRWSSWVELVIAPKNGGFAYGNNLAFRRAYDDGPPAYFHLLNPDTRVLKGAIGELVHFLEAHPSVGIAGSSLKNQDGGDLSFAFRFPSILTELESGLQFRVAARILKPWAGTIEAGPDPQRVDWVAGASMLIRRSVLDSIGGFDENYFLYFEETDFCFRAKKAGFSTWHVPGSHVVHISGQSTKVTDHKAAPKRFPTYWFESRCRYFVATYGIRYAIACDVTAMLAHGFGSLKHFALRRKDPRIPRFLTDLARHSSLWPQNRKVAPVKSFVPHS